MTTAIRTDLRLALERRLQGQVEKSVKEQPFSAILNESGSIDLERLSEKDKESLQKLQEASEGLEALFIKDLLGKMRRAGFGEKPDAMEEQIRDWMDEAIADNAAKSPAGVGIARTVFLDAATRVVNQAAAALPQIRKENHV
jgi:Rod binding domain-containing protein